MLLYIMVGCFAITKSEIEMGSFGKKNVAENKPVCYNAAIKIVHIQFKRKFFGKGMVWIE